MNKVLSEGVSKGEETDEWQSSVKWNDETQFKNPNTRPYSSMEFYILEYEIFYTREDLA